MRMASQAGAKERPSKTRFKLLLALALLLCAGGCIHVHRVYPSDPNLPPLLSYGELLERNNANFPKIQVGMTKDELLNLMGVYRVKQFSGIVFDPYKTEVFQVDGAGYEIIHYPLRRGVAAQPVVLKDALVVGWGREAVKAIASRKR